MSTSEEINGDAGDGITAIIDSSGLKITERGELPTTEWKGKVRADGSTRSWSSRMIYDPEWKIFSDQEPVNV